MSVSSGNLRDLPEPRRLETLMQSLAMLDAILEPEWEYRYYSFDAHWSGNERMGSMRNGSGDEFFVLFSDAGCYVMGFAHERWIDSVPSDAFYHQVPAVFGSAVTEPAFSPDLVTFCLWREARDTQWRSALVPEYFEVEINPEAVAQFYAHAPLTEAEARRLNPAADFEMLKEEALGIGYPLAG